MKKQTFIGESQSALDFKPFLSKANILPNSILLVKILDLIKVLDTTLSYEAFDLILC